MIKPLHSPLMISELQLCLKFCAFFKAYRREHWGNQRYQWGMQRSEATLYLAVHQWPSSWHKRCKSVPRVNKPFVHSPVTQPSHFNVVQTLHCALYQPSQTENLLVVIERSWTNEADCTKQNVPETLHLQQPVAQWSMVQDAVDHCKLLGDA